MTALVRRLALVGPRGAGKSTIAEPLARELGFEAVDADAELAQRAGLSAGEFLRRFGEPAFRALEREVTGELLRRDGVVVATGGGAVLDPDLRRLLRGKGTFCALLLAPVPVLVARLALEPAARPRLTDLPPEREVESLLAVRLPLYREVAHTELDTSACSVEAAVLQLAARVRSHRG